MTERIHLGGMTNTTVHIETDGTIHVEEKQDAQAILDRNQQKRDHRFSGSGDFREAFDIPMVLVKQWQKECGARMLSDEHMAYMNAKLREPEFRYLNSAPPMRDAHVIVKGAR